MIDRVLTVLLPILLLGLPWGHVYAPGWTLGAVALVGVLAWSETVMRARAGSARWRWGIGAWLAFLVLVAVSLMNGGQVDPGDRTPGAARLVEEPLRWLPATLDREVTARWLLWWTGTLGSFLWLLGRPRPDRLRMVAWLALLVGAVVTVLAGLAGKAGLLLPGFTDHHGVFQPFGYRNHGVAYAILGATAGAVLSIRWWGRRRFAALAVGCVTVALVVVLPWSQARLAFLPQLVALVLLLLGVLKLLWGRLAPSPAWRLALVLSVSGMAAVGLGYVWMRGELTGRMRDTHRQIEAIREGAYPDLRLPSAGTAWEAGAARFPWGWGAGSFVEFLPLFAGPAFYAERYQPETRNFGYLIPSPAAHNDWAEWWAEFGAIGILLLAGGGWLVLRSEGGRWRFEGLRCLPLAAGSGTFLVVSLIDYPLHYPPLLFVAGAFFSLVGCELERGKAPVA